MEVGAFYRSKIGRRLFFPMMKDGEYRDVYGNRCSIDPGDIVYVVGKLSESYKKYELLTSSGKLFALEFFEIKFFEKVNPE